MVLFPPHAESSSAMLGFCRRMRKAERRGGAMIIRRWRTDEPSPTPFFQAKDPLSCRSLRFSFVMWSEGVCKEGERSMGEASDATWKSAAALVGRIVLAAVFAM